MMGLPLVGPSRRDRKASRGRGRSRRAFAQRAPLEALEARSLLSQVFTVTNTSDTTGSGSLRWAIGQVNSDGTDAAASPDQIHFNIPTTDSGFNATTGVWTIAPATALPNIGAPCIIDGYTQTGAVANTSAAADNATIKVELDGGPTGNIQFGLQFVTGSGTSGTTPGTVSGVEGLAIHSFEADVTFNASGIFVQGCFIGTNAAGAAPAGRPTESNAGAGVVASLFFDVIGGTDPAERDLISNCDTGVVTNSGGELIAGDLIGTGPTGTVALPNGDGIVLQNAGNNTVGGTTAASRNVISGNDDTGIDIEADSDDSVEGNYIGTDVTGTRALGNGIDGILVDTGEGNTVGGTDPGAANVISANGGQNDGVPTAGVYLSGGDTGGSNENFIEGNLIGTDAAGTGPLGNTGNGIRIDLGDGNAFLDNIIDFNTRIGIDLVGGTEDSFGVTANSPGGGHFGPNDLQNYPVLTSAVASSGQTVITGTLNSNPLGTFRIDLYAVPTADPSGHGQALTFLGTKIVTTDASDNTTPPFSLTVPSDLVGRQITALATELDTDATPPRPSSTSEFSADIPVTGTAAPSADVAVTLVSSTSPVTAGGAVSFTYKIANLGPDTATGVAAVDTLPTNLAGATATASQGQSTLVDGKFTDFVSSLPVGGSFTVTVTGDAFTAGTIDNELIAAASETDPVPTNNTATVSIAVVRSTAVLSLEVKPNPSTFGQAVTFSAFASNRFIFTGGAPGGTITFSVDGVPTATVPLTIVTNPGLEETNSFAVFSTSSLAAGSHVITAHYSGDANDSPSDATPVTLVVNPAATTTTLVAQPNPSAVGQPVTFTAAVAPTPLADGPTGSVTFFIDGVGFTSPVVPSADGLTGTATFTISSLAAGTHAAIARYNGDANFATSQSQAIVETVNTPAPPAAAPRVVEVLRYGFHALPTALAVVFDTPLDPARATDVANYRLVGPRGRSIPIVAAALLPGDEAVVLQPKDRLNVHWTYTLTIIGTPPRGLTGASGTFIGFDPVETITLRNLVFTRAPFVVAHRAASPKPPAHAVDAVLASGHLARARSAAARWHRG